MWHHLRKAKEIYRDAGVLEVSESALRYIPVEIKNLLFRLQQGRGTRIMNEDWDNLFILDACRYDLFAENVQLSGKLESRISLGSSSEEFLERNFDDGPFHDTVYVNANPYVPKLGLDSDTFHSVVDCLDSWDDELETVRPETVSAAAKEAARNFPDKRLIIHYMQPHTPFIGETGKKIGTGGWTVGEDVHSLPSIWEQLRTGSVNPDLAWQAYQENLKLVLDEINPLLASFGGKSVVTSDHGNLFGERIWPFLTSRRYGHPYGVHTEELVKVPWFVVDSEQRRNTTEDPPVEQETISNDEVENRLQALGYK